MSGDPNQPAEGPTPSVCFFNGDNPPHASNAGRQEMPVTPNATIIASSIPTADQLQTPSPAEHRFAQQSETGEFYDLRTDWICSLLEPNILYLDLLLLRPVKVFKWRYRSNRGKGPGVWYNDGRTLEKGLNVRICREPELPTVDNIRWSLGYFSTEPQEHIVIKDAPRFDQVAEYCDLTGDLYAAYRHVESYSE